MIDFTNVTELKLGNALVERVTDSLGVVLWEVSRPEPEPDPANSYFYMEDISGSDNTLSIVKNDTSAPTIEVFKSSDGTNWESMGNTDTTAITATIPANSKLYIKSVSNTWGNSYYNNITASGAHNVGGNIMSLLYGDNFRNQTTFPSGGSNFKFFNIFCNNRNLVSAIDLALPATTLTDYCYCDMFNGCTSLTTAPALPATTLGQSVYERMFYRCTALTTAPALPATTLGRYCYSNMFNGCTALTTAPELPATTLIRSCYQSMFYRCTALTTAPVLPATTVALECCRDMFYGCTRLTTAPVLPATTLAENCYQNMFKGCTSLNSVTTYATDVSADRCLADWLDGVSSTGDFFNLGNPAPTYSSGASGIPTGWTEHTSL